MSGLTHAMIDLETLAITPSARILQIGVVIFDKHAILEQKDWLLNPFDGSQESGSIDARTVHWWETSAPEEARNSVYSPPSDAVFYGIAPVLEQFRLMLFNYPGTRVWANGAAFDLPILSWWYSKLGTGVPWMFRHERCWRTVYYKNKYRVSRQAVVIAHTALEDCHNQIRFLRQLPDSEWDF